jgi:3-dehydroquinate synthase
MTASHETIRVDLGERAYDVVVGDGAIADLGALILPHLDRPLVVLVTDENVAALHLEAATGSLQAAGIDTSTIVLPAGESTKSFAMLERLTADLLDRGV